MNEENVVNVNIGVLGHVDSGKTSFCAAISTVLSTAALDKSPQSQERGITQDLQFSAFRVEKSANGGDAKLEKNDEIVPENPAQQPAPTGKTVFNFTLVDCPGHASLIRTIIGGSSIIDMVILVIDVTKGIQTQTAEGIIIAELVTKDLVILLNKLDMVEEAERETRANLLKTRISKVLSGSGFRRIDFVPFAAKPSKNDVPIGLDELKRVLSTIEVPKRLNVDAPMLMSVDHCFSIKGQGSVATGTLLRGAMAINQVVQVVGQPATYKVKSMEVFKKRVKLVTQGERVGVLLPNLDASLLERGLLSLPGSVSFVDGLVVSLNKIRYYKSDIDSGAKIHISIGHSTVLAKTTLFAPPTDQSQSDKNTATSSDAKNSTTDSTALDVWSPSEEYEFLKNLGAERTHCFALLHLEKKIAVPSDSIYIASKLDADIHSPTCRLAFHGKVLSAFSSSPSTISAASSSTSSSSNTSSSKNNAPNNDAFTLNCVKLSSLRISTTKERIGSIDRVVDDYVLIGRGMFKKETNMTLFIGLPVRIGEHVGTIDSSFGASGKFKVRFSAAVAKSIPNTTPIVLTLRKQKFSESKNGK